MEANDIALEITLYNITWLRKKHGLSKVAMANMLGISRYTLNKIERGRMPPRLGCEIFLTIYRKFGIRPSVLVSQRLEETENARYT